MHERMNDYTTRHAGKDVNNDSAVCGEAKKGSGTSLRLHGGDKTNTVSLACKEGEGGGVPWGRYRNSRDLELQGSRTG